MVLALASVGCSSKPKTIIGTWVYYDWLIPMRWTYRFNSNGTYIQDLHADDAYGGKQWIREEGAYTYTAQDLILTTKTITSETIGGSRAKPRRTKPLKILRQTRWHAWLTGPNHLRMVEVSETIGTLPPIPSADPSDWDYQRIAD